MLQNAYLLAKIGADTDENEQHFAESLSKIGNCPTGAGRVPRLHVRPVTSLHVDVLRGRGEHGVPVPLTSEATPGVFYWKEAPTRRSRTDGVPHYVRCLYLQLPRKKSNKQDLTTLQV